MAHFKDLIDQGKRSPENLKAALGEIVTYTHDVQSEGKGGEHGGGEGHIINVGGKRYQYKGSGDTADRANYTQIGEKR